MGMSKSFNAVPIQMGKRYRRKTALRRHKTTATFLGAAAIVGAIIGVAELQRLQALRRFRAAVEPRRLR